MNEEAAVESHHQHHHDHSPQQSQMIDSIEKDRLDDVVVEEDEHVPEIELKKKRESIGNQSDDSIENQPCVDDENDEDEAESRMKQEIIEERINTRGVKFVADSAIVGGTNPSLISSTNSNISSTSSMSKSSSLNNNNNNTNSNPSQTSPSSQQPQQPIQQQQQSSANSQSSSPSLSVSPRIKSQTNSKSEKISPGLAKRVQAPEEEDNNQQEEQHNQNQEEENIEVVEEKQTKITTLAGSSNRRTMAPSSTASKSASSKSANPAAAAAKIQNALEKNMQRLNLYRPNSQSAGHKQQHAANLSKEDIELFTNPDYDSSSTTLASSSSINGSNGNQEEDAEYSTTTTTTTSRSIKPTGTVGGPYYLGKIPEHKTVEQSSSKTKGHYQQQQQQCQQVINRSSTDREMTPDSIDNDTPQHRVSTRPNTGSRLVSKRGVNTNTSTSRNIPKKTPINQRSQPQTQPQPQPQKPAQQKIGVGKVNGNRKIVIPDEEEEERYEESGAANSRCGKAVAVAKKVPPAATAAAASVQQLDEEDELNNGVYIEEQDEDELDEDEYERYHRHHHHHHHHHHDHDHEHYEDEEDDDDEYLDEDAEQHDDYDDDYDDEQDHSHNAHNYNNQRHVYHHYPHDHEHHHAHHRQHQENNNTNKNNRSQYTKTTNYNNPIPKPIEPKTSGAVSSSSRTANNTNIRQDQVSKTRRVSTESESSTSKASANANKAAKPGKSEAMSRSATSGDCSARRPGGPVRRKSTTASDDREFIDTDEETNKLLDTTRTVTEYHDEETDEDKARRNGQDKSAVAAKSSNPSTSSQDNDRNVDRQQKSKETQPPPSTTHQIMDPDNQVLIEGVLFRARYLGSTQLVTDGNPTKLTRMLQAQEAVGRIKAPEGESQPSVEVDLFVSTEKIMVLNTDLQLDNLEIMMDHSLRSISYIADIGNLVVLMAKRRPPGGGQESGQAAAAAAAATSAPSKILCHVFESPEAQLVAQSIGQAFQVAYMEYLRANGIDDLTIMKDLDYQEVLNQQEIMGNELAMFAKKECQKEVLVPKQKNEPLGLVIVESGWGSMLPTVVVANMAPTGPAARCGALNIGDQIISCNGISMVGLPLSTCQTHVKNTRHLTLVRLVVVPCPPVVEVLIKRPDTKYQLGFSVQDGIICSLLRGGIAERGGVRVGHRIIEINGHSVVATTHDKIVNMLANSVGELRMKTMPTQMFRLLTGQELPVYI